MHRIGGVILAAGGSTRLGRPKQLLEIGGETLVHAAVRAALEGGCDRVCVVTGHARVEVEAAVADLHPALVHNEHWSRGMGGSIRCGLRARGSVSAIVLLVCDQPALDGAVVRSLIAQYDESGLPIVASHYAGTLGIPALFDHICFAELESLADDRGAKGVIQANTAREATIEFPGGALDLDTPADLHAWRMREGLAMGSQR